MKDEKQRWIINIEGKQYSVDRIANSPAMFVGEENDQVRHIFSDAVVPFVFGKGDIIIIASRVPLYELTDRQRYVVQTLIDKGSAETAAKLEDAWQDGRGCNDERSILQVLFMDDRLFEQLLKADDFAHFRAHMKPGAVEKENELWAQEHSE